jgi:hypothetical protein
LPIITSDKLVMSRENSKIFTYAFCKNGALQFCGPIVEELEPILVSKRLGLDEAELEPIGPIVALVESSMT